MAVLSCQINILSCIFNTGSYAFYIMYLSSFNVNTSSSKPVNLKSLKTIIIKDNTEFILRA
jgi:hypothetical protein